MLTELTSYFDHLTRSPRRACRLFSPCLLHYSRATTAHPTRLHTTRALRATTARTDPRLTIRAPMGRTRQDVSLDAPHPSTFQVIASNLIRSSLFQMRRVALAAQVADTRTLTAKHPARLASR